MKKTLFLLTLSILSLIGYSQSSEESYYKARTTELYTKNEYTGKWELYQKNGTTNITVVVEENFISIQAQKPTIYKIYRGNIQEIETETLSGSRYTAKDLKAEEFCTIDIVKLKNTNMYLISVINGKINLRYYVEVE